MLAGKSPGDRALVSAIASQGGTQSIIAPRTGHPREVPAATLRRWTWPAFTGLGRGALSEPWPGATKPTPSPPAEFLDTRRETRGLTVC